MHWEESAYLISRNSNKFDKIIKVQSLQKNGWKYEKIWKIAVFAWKLFLKMNTYDNINRIKNSAWCQTHAYQISSKNIENWQSY